MEEAVAKASFRSPQGRGNACNSVSHSCKTRNRCDLGLGKVKSLYRVMEALTGASLSVRVT